MPTGALQAPITPRIRYARPSRDQKELLACGADESDFENIEKKLISKTTPFKLSILLIALRLSPYLDLLN